MAADRGTSAVGDSRPRIPAALLELISSAVLIRDAETGALRWWNAAAAELYRYAPEDAYGRDADELLQTHWDGGTLADARAALERDGEFSAEMRRRAAGGTEVVVLVRQVR